MTSTWLKCFPRRELCVDPVRRPQPTRQLAAQASAATQLGGPNSVRLRESPDSILGDGRKLELASVAMNVRYPVDVESEDHELVSSARRRELVCSLCGYGIIVEHAPERCPMCGSQQWDFAPWRPFRGAGLRGIRAR
jgi:hypothetical protein